MPKTVAVVVRRPDVRDTFAKPLRKAGARLVTGELGAEAYNLAQDTAALLVLDLHLEDAHGDAVCRDIKKAKETAAPPVILLIEEDDDWFRERGEDAGADAILTYAEATRIVALAGKLLRTDVRVEAAGAVKFYLVESSRKQVQTGQLLDISTSGIAFQIAQSELEQDFLLDLQVAIAGGPKVVGRARVVRSLPTSEHYRVVVRWEAFRKGDRERLANWIRNEAAKGQSSAGTAS